MSSDSSERPKPGHPAISYKLKRITENIRGLPLELETLKDLNETIDEIFSQIEGSPENSAGDSGDARQNQNKLGLLEDLCPYFGVVWPAARALAEHLTTLGPLTLQGARILEVGCGLALPAMVAAKLGAQVTATDFHPEVPRFLKRNLELNGISNLEYRELNWREALDPEKELGLFDWVIASDVLYEKEHPLSVAQTLSRFAGKKGRIIVADPARPYLQPFVDEMDRLGYRHDMLIKTVPDAPVSKDVFLVVLNRRFGS